MRARALRLGTTMECEIKEALQTKTLKPFGHAGGGCINEGHGYLTDTGKVFVKWNAKPGARLMFDGEFASLTAILETGTIKVPKPMHVLDKPRREGAVLIMEYLDMKPLSSHSSELGEKLARMHLHNQSLGEKLAAGESSVHKQGEGAEYVNQFGFDTTTCCGYIPQDNTWNKDWVTFLIKNKLGYQLKLAEEKYGDREASQLWPVLQKKIPAMFEGLDIKPALLHGDLWGGNASEIDNEPVIYDPASFYGHHEFELGIAGMFGGFSSTFHNAYHSLIPKAKGFEKRKQLYELFHYLNHWNHFGGGYRGQSISIMTSLAK